MRWNSGGESEQVLIGSVQASKMGSLDLPWEHVSLLTT